MNKEAARWAAFGVDRNNRMRQLLIMFDLAPPILLLPEKVCYINRCETTTRTAKDEDY